MAGRAGPERVTHLQDHEARRDQAGHRRIPGARRHDLFQGYPRARRRHHYGYRRPHRFRDASNHLWRIRRRGLRGALLRPADGGRVLQPVNSTRDLPHISDMECGELSPLWDSWKYERFPDSHRGENSPHSISKSAQLALTQFALSVTIARLNDGNRP